MNLLMYRLATRLFQFQHLSSSGQGRICYRNPVAVGGKNLFRPPSINMSIASNSTNTTGEAAKKSTDLPIKTIALELFKRRVEEKEKQKSRKFLILNNADLQVLGCNCQSFGPSLIVRSEGGSYLFNCSEGFQRLCFSNKIRLLDLENVFITHHDWKRVSGLFGLSLTLQDNGSPSLCVHSTPGIENIFNATKNFMQFTTGIKTLTKTYLDGDYKDNCITIHPIPIHQNTEASPTDQQMEADNSDTSREQSSAKRQKTQAKVVAYVCTLPDLPGALNPQKCKELKVPIGKQLAVLKSGQDITLQDGTVVRSVDVCEPKNQGLRFLVVECPSDDFINSLVTNVELNKLRANRRILNNGREIGLVAHFSPHKVTSDPRYRQWMKTFSAECKHLFLTPKEPSKINFSENYRVQYMLNKFDSEIFPMLSLPPKAATQFEEQLNNQTTETQDETMKRDLDPSPMICRTEYEKLDNVIETNLLDKLIIRPHTSFETVENLKTYDAIYQEATLGFGFDKSLAELREAQQKLPKAKEYEPELVMLGTGSALPAKLRNTSCILFNFYYPAQASVIMDCGEDSYGQLFRMYGPKRAHEILKQLKLIYVSHHHADHHIGLTKLLVERKKVTNERLILLLPPGVENLLNYYNQNFEDLSDTYEIFTTSPLKTSPSTGFNSTPVSKLNKQLLKQKLNGFLDDITVVGVNHCFHSCAVTMSFKIGHPNMDTFTVAYSGDARPSLDLIESAKNCDLLIHEATFDFRSQHDAVIKKHCTSTEAIEVAKKMNAKFTILTHFSQKLPKIPYFTEEFDETIGFAFDNMVLKCPSHFPRLPILKPLLSIAFKKSLNDLDTQYIKSQNKQRVHESVASEEV